MPLDQMEIGLFGGSFNPPHLCHALATLWVLEARELEEVWWLPTYEHAFDKQLLAYEHRREMCERAIRRIDGVRLSDVERDLGGESRTIDTVRELESRRPADDFTLIVGSDILDETDEWKQWDELVDRVQLLVVRREDYGDGEQAGADFWLPDVSSTEIRKALRRGERARVEDWVASSVLEYVEAHGLYT